MPEYLKEPFDELPHGSPGKARRYATEMYQGATGRNWYTADPTLQALLLRYLGPEALAWAYPHLVALGALMGGPVSERAELTDKNPPWLQRYDKWGRDVSRIVLPESFEATRRDLRDIGFTSEAFLSDARAAGADPEALRITWLYLLNQAEVGMACALTTGEPMVQALADSYAPDDVKERVKAIFQSGGSAGEAAQLLTERSGGTDLAALETTATPNGDDSWSLNGFKWFVSNVGAPVYVVLAKPEGRPDQISGIAPFLVLASRRNGERNGVRIRQLKDKLGTKAVASGEVELVDAEAFLLSPPDLATLPGRTSTPGFARMMQLTNTERLHVSMNGLGCARRALMESLCYASTREAFGRRLIELPLIRRKLTEMIVEVEAAQALVFDGFLGPELRIAAPLIKLRAARLGLTMASDAVEMHGGNGYIETWPVARILRDAQVNTVWEGPDNVLCLDVRRALRQQGHKHLLDRLRVALDSAATEDASTTDLVRQRIDELEAAIEHWFLLDDATAEARLFPLAQFMVDVYAAALLLEQAGWEVQHLLSSRKSMVARLYVQGHLADVSRFDRVAAQSEELDVFDELLAGALSFD